MKRPILYSFLLFASVSISAQEFDIFDRVAPETILLDSVNAAGTGKRYNIYLNGQLESVYEYVNFQLHGIQREWYENGALKFERRYVNGKKEGVEKGFYESGKPLYETIYKNDIMDGKAISWYETGGKLYENVFVAGKREGVETAYYPDGKVRYKTTYKNDVRDGKTTGWHETGKKKFESNFVDGKREGLEAGFFPNGKRMYEYFFANDTIIRLTAWEEDGTVNFTSSDVAEIKEYFVEMEKQSSQMRENIQQISLLIDETQEKITQMDEETANDLIDFYEIYKLTDDMEIKQIFLEYLVRVKNSYDNTQRPYPTRLKPIFDAFGF